MRIETSTGDAADRISVLLLKSERIAEGDARAHVRRELSTLLNAWEGAGLPPPGDLGPWPELHEVNGRLWEVEEALRRHEADQDFGAEFIALARTVYRLNDRRAALKRQISEATASELIEVKSYRIG
jgi:hypothetical protein